MKTYNMAIYFNKKTIYELEVEANSVEEAREIVWDNFIQVAYADEEQKQEQLEYFENITEDEITFKQYLKGTITYEEYSLKCLFLNCKPHSRIEHVSVVLGICDNLNFYNLFELIEDFDYLKEKYNEEKIWLKGDYGVYVKGKIIDKKGILVVVE